MEIEKLTLGYTEWNIFTLKVFFSISKILLHIFIILHIKCITLKLLISYKVTSPNIYENITKLIAVRNVPKVDIWNTCDYIFCINNKRIKIILHIYEFYDYFSYFFEECPWYFDWNHSESMSQFR